MSEDTATAPAGMAVIPTWLLRSTLVSVPAKMIYLYLSALSDGTPLTVTDRDLFVALPDLLGFTPAGAFPNSVCAWLDELASTTLIELTPEGETPGPWTIRFDLYRKDAAQ